MGSSKKRETGGCVLWLPSAGSSKRPIWGTTRAAEIEGKRKNERKVKKNGKE